MIEVCTHTYPLIALEILGNGSPGENRAQYQAGDLRQSLYHVVNRPSILLASLCSKYAPHPGFQIFLMFPVESDVSVEG